MKALIIDDEKLAGENLKLLLRKYCNEITSITTINNVVPAIDFLKKTPPDILFLDIHLNETDGFKLLNAIKDRSFHIVMVSADDSYGLKAIKEEVVDYILKPIDIIDLKQAVSKVYSKFSDKKDHNTNKIVVPTQNGNRLISPDEIMRVEAQSNYSKIYCSDNTSILVSKPLKTINEMLNNETFFRLHKSHLVKLTAIKSYSRSNLEVVLNDNTVLPLSRRNVSDFLNKIQDKTKSI